VLWFFTEIHTLVYVNNRLKKRVSGSASSEKANHVLEPFHSSSFLFLLLTVCGFTCQSKSMSAFFIYVEFKRHLVLREFFCKMQAVPHIQQFILKGMPDKTRNGIFVYIT